MLATHEEKELAKLPVVSIQDVLLTRMIAREEGARLGFSPQALTQIATAVSEITRNVVQHAGAPGQMRLFRTSGAGGSGLRIIVEDSGVGIAGVDRVITGTSPGAGIPGCVRLMDEFEIDSHSGEGTIVNMTKWLASGA